MSEYNPLLDKRTGHIHHLSQNCHHPQRLPSHSRHPCFFLVATVRCQEIPRLPKQSDWLSLNFLGKNFIAQSSTRSVDS